MTAHMSIYVAGKTDHYEKQCDFLFVIGISRTGFTPVKTRAGDSHLRDRFLRTFVFGTYARVITGNALYTSATGHTW